MLPNVGIHFPSHGNKIRNPMSYDMSLRMLWMALTCRATSSGRYGRRISPFGVLMPGKGIGFNWTNVVSLARLELSTSSMPSVTVHNALGGQRQSSLGYSFLPYCGGCSHHAAGGQQIHAHPKAYPSGTEGNRIKQKG